MSSKDNRFAVIGTTTENRIKSKDDYIICVSKEAKRKLGRFAVISHLVRSNDEERQLMAHCRVILDESLNGIDPPTIRTDQTVRNAIGIPLQYDPQKTFVDLHPLRVSPFEQIRQFLTYWLGRRYLLLRVAKPHIPDLEKSLCRIPGDAFELLGTVSGSKVVIETPLSQVRIRLNSLKRSTGPQRSSPAIALKRKRRARLIISLLEQTKRGLNALETKTLAGVLRGPTHPSALIDLEERLVLGNPEAIRNFEQNVIPLIEKHNFLTYTLKSRSIRAYTLLNEIVSERKQRQEQGDDKIEGGYSFFARYPNAEKLLGVRPDLNEVYLDAHEREKLGVDSLDPVKVERSIWDLFLRELMAFGITFFLSLFTILNSEPLKGFFEKRLHLGVLLGFVISLLLVLVNIRARVK